MDPSDGRRKELGAFLRARREKVSPQQAGLPALGRRRTPGLRREEVAQLAGIGTTWYTWLEQGRAAGVSDQVLEAVARVLDLTEAERRHMLVLADRAPVHRAPPITVGPEQIAVLEQLLPFPAAIQDDAYEIVATNRSYRYLFSDLDAYPVEERNCAWLMFTDPVWRGSLVEEERVLPEIVGRLRAHLAEHHDDPRWSTLVERLREKSEDFRRLWEHHEVADERPRRRVYASPRAGLLTVHFQSLWIDRRSGARLVVMSPADALTRDRLERHAALLEAAPAWTAREDVVTSLAG
ncbi:helix-turn-helix transcriptional regulator [Brachybacterium sp. GCM10030267]|uniref:helix-turn-helix transcriptional regulator n=1 Tax=unclassified Brachybacterium TaxID=2623841 RepID=UPI00360D26D0